MKPSPPHGALRRWTVYSSMILCGLFGLGLKESDAPAGQQVEAKGTDKGSEEGGEKSFKGKAVVISIDTEDLAQGPRFRSLTSLLHQVNEEEAAAVVLDLNVTTVADLSVTRRIAEELPALKPRSLAFVNPSALSAGAFLALGTESIYMAPTGIVGGAGVEVAGGEEDEEAQRRSLAQTLSILKARARTLAKNRGHDPAIAEAFVDSDVEVKRIVNGTEVTISSEGDILTLTADEATQKIEGKPLLAKGVVSSVEELLAKEGIKAPIFETSPREFQTARAQKNATASHKADKDAEDGDQEEAGGIFDKREGESYRDRILVIPVGEEDLISTAKFDFMIRTLKKARLDGAAAVIFDIDSPGGYAWYTKGLALDDLQGLPFPTFAFVNTRAESAGAMVALATDEIYMRPAATIGSALVVSGSGGDLSESMDQKVTQMAIAVVRNIAELKGHNPDIAQAMVTTDTTVIIGGEVVWEAGRVLNFNTIQATEIIDGEPVLAKGVVNSVEEIVEREALEGEILKVEPLGLEAFAHWVQMFSAVLILFGVAGAYMELQSPGFGVPGVVSLLCFGLFFFGNNMAGNLAGYELLVLLVLGLLLVGVELFILPGTLIPGIVGGLLIFGSLIFAMVDRYDFQFAWEGLPEAPSFGDILMIPLLYFVVGVSGAVVAILLLMRYLPETPMGSWLILKQAVPGGASLQESGAVLAEGSEPHVPVSLIGQTGSATTDLRPAGKGTFGDRYLDIVSDGEFIERGSPLKIVKHEGSRIVVSKAEDSSSGT